MPNRRWPSAAPGCGVSWNLLAGIGRIESGHAGGGAVDARGTAVVPIYGPSLDGTLPGNEVILQSSAGNRVTYARAMGPMQFLPGTWARYASDGKGDGIADPQNLFDSTLAAARYLCSGGLNLRDPSQVMAAILRYNNSMPYAQNVLGWAAAYATGVVPVDLPPITGPPPPLGDAHDEHPEGLGPEPADEHQRPADGRPDGADAADRLDRQPQCASAAADVPVDDPGHATAGADPAARLHADLHRPAEPAARRRPHRWAPPPVRANAPRRAPPARRHPPAPPARPLAAPGAAGPRRRPADQPAAPAPARKALDGRPAPSPASVGGRSGTATSPARSQARRTPGERVAGRRTDRPPTLGGDVPS